MLHTLALTLTPKVGPCTLSLLIDRFGSAEAITAMSYDQLKEAGVSSSVALSLTSDNIMDKARNVMELCQRSNIRILVRGTEQYPALLNECDDAPWVLYVRGELDFNRGRWVSVVGTRKATEHGLYDTERLVTGLGAAYEDLVVVSGLAFGIDKAAHVSALNHSIPTVAVMPGWVDDITPRSHYYVARRILGSKGAVVSDMPPGTAIARGSFLSRNRIIAGLSHATVVVESAAKGGSLITADIASSYNREVFAMPGRSDDSACQGTNNLIKSSRAILYQEVSDIAQSMGWPRTETRQGIETPTDLPPALAAVFCTMPDTEPITLDEICQKLELSVGQASSALMHLEVRGLIKSLPGRLYQKAKY